MASKTPLRCIHRVGAPSLRPSLSASISTAHLSCRYASSDYSPRDSGEIPSKSTSEQLPRWAQTPPLMVAPVRSRPLPLHNVFQVNTDPKKLDEAYVKMLGTGGESLLSDETKWLVMTHKSFDHGRRGFNDRLVYLGKRIVDLQTSLALLEAPKPSSSSTTSTDDFGRTPFTHTQLSGLANLQPDVKRTILDEARLAQLAKKYGFSRVVRWKPRKASDLQASGEDTVLAGSLYAVIGALALEKGGEVANKTVRSKILGPLGL